MDAARFFIAMAGKTTPEAEECHFLEEKRRDFLGNNLHPNFIQHTYQARIRAAN